MSCRDAGKAANSEKPLVFLSKVLVQIVGDKGELFFLTVPALVAATRFFSQTVQFAGIRYRERLQQNGMH